MATELDRDLNLIVPIERDSGTIFVHSAPIGHETFEKYYLVISKVFAELLKEGVSAFAGPRIAAVALKDMAQKMDCWEGPHGVNQGLMQEIIRLSNVVMQGESGAFETIPLHTALVRKMLTDVEVREVQGAIVFFIVSSCMHQRKNLELVLQMTIGMLWGGQTTSLNSTEFAASLQTSTETGSGGEKGGVSVTV